MDQPFSPRRGTGITLAFICLVVLGLMPIIAIGRPAGSSALSFALWLSVWQLLFSLPLLALEWQSGEHGLFGERMPRAERWRVLGVTLFTGGLFSLSTWMYVLAFEKAGAVNAAIALQAYPLFAAALEAVFLRRRKSALELGFMLLVVVALYYLATQGTWQLAGPSFWFLLALAVPLVWSVAHIIVRQALLSTPITPSQVTTSRLVVSTIFLSVLAVSLEGFDSIPLLGLDFQFQIFAVAMGLAYYVELIVCFYAVRHIDVSVASSITVPAPAVTMVLSALLFNETVTGLQIMVLGVVILGLTGLLFAGSRTQGAASYEAG